MLYCFTWDTYNLSRVPFSDLQNKDISNDENLEVSGTEMADIKDLSRLQWALSANQ